MYKNNYCVFHKMFKFLLKNENDSFLQKNDLINYSLICFSCGIIVGLFYP